MNLISLRGSGSEQSGGALKSRVLRKARGFMNNRRSALRVIGEKQDSFSSAKNRDDPRLEGKLAPYR
jgi:hypothetical protein